MYRRIRKIADRIIDESFPQLQGKRIIILVLRFKFYALSLWIPPVLRIIVVSTRAKHLNDEAITGLIAHELCHQERYCEMGIRKYMKFLIMYVFSDKTRRNEEHEADRRTIEKNYACELYELTLASRSDKKHKKIIDNYLTPEEIKSYALQTGKWNQSG